VIPFGKARQVMAGDDITIVSWAQAMPVAEAAALQLKEQGMGVDLFDLRSLWPWDETAVLASVNRTKRLVVVQEGVGASGFAAEVVSTIAEKASGLKGIRRVASPRIPVPFAPQLEAACFITAEMVTRAANELLSR
jgi:acetoin:2,6-dichlorophenolindophenol oxidoreductase subunit beta